MDKISPQRALLSVSDLTTRARQLLETELAQLWVVGEIATISRPASGHWYFTLKDDRAQIRCVMFRQQSLQTRPPAQGDEVLVLGRISLYEPRGDLQLIVAMLEPRGTGVLYRRFEALKAQLQAEGLFAPELKRPLPHYPAAIGLVTSKSGAALQDMLNTAARLAPGVELLLYPCTVQGDTAATEIREALALANQHAQAEVLVVGRGGGSYEDLFCFNDEALARAIRQSAIPVVSAVGHEVDFTIADFVADQRAPTPTAALELVLREHSELKARLAVEHRHLGNLINRSLGQRAERLHALGKRLRSPQIQLQHLQQRLDRIEASLGQSLLVLIKQGQTRLREWRERLRLASPQRQILDVDRRLTQLQQSLLQAMHRRLQQHRETLAHRLALLEGVSPLATVRRGYSILTDAQGKVVRSVSQVKTGDPLEARVSDGRLHLQVRKIPGPGK